MLDVGVGCGLVAAAAAWIVGPTGRVTGLDVRQVGGRQMRGRTRLKFKFKFFSWPAPPPPDLGLCSSLGCPSISWPRPESLDDGAHAGMVTDW